MKDVPAGFVRMNAHSGGFGIVRRPCAPAVCPGCGLTKRNDIAATGNATLPRHTAECPVAVRLAARMIARYSPVDWVERATHTAIHAADEYGVHSVLARFWRRVAEDRIPDGLPPAPDIIPAGRYLLESDHFIHENSGTIPPELTETTQCRHSPPLWLVKLLPTVG